MIVLEKMEQGSEEWLQARKGRATASEFKSILTPTGKLSKSAEGYMMKLARECVIDDPQQFAGNKFTEWGHEHEPAARDTFSQIMGLDAQEVGFCTSDSNPVLGASPDALIRDEEKGWIAGLEIKCLQVDNHVKCLMAGGLPNDYKLQVHGSMVVTGLNVWYFMSYFPGLNPLIVKVERDEFTDKLSEVLNQFVGDYAPVRAEVLKAILPTSNEEVAA